MTLDEYKDKHSVQLFEALNQFDKVHTPRGFINTKENGEALLKHLADNNMPPTLASLEQSSKMHVEHGWKFYLTPDEQALNAVRAQYPAETLALFDRWYSYQHIEKNPRTEAAILSEARGHVVDKERLELCLGRAASKGLVTFSKAPGQESYVRGQYSGNEKLAKEDWKPEEIIDPFGKLLVNRKQGIAGAQYEAKVQRDVEAGRTPADQTESYWVERADKACGANLASTRGELTRMVVSSGGKIDWKATALKREQMQKGIGSR